MNAKEMRSLLEVSTPAQASLDQVLDFIKMRGQPEVYFQASVVGKELRKALSDLGYKVSAEKERVKVSY